MRVAGDLSDVHHGLSTLADDRELLQRRLWKQWCKALNHWPLLGMCTNHQSSQSWSTLGDSTGGGLLLFRGSRPQAHPGQQALWGEWLHLIWAHARPPCRPVIPQ